MYVLRTFASFFYESPFQRFFARTNFTDLPFNIGHYVTTLDDIIIFGAFGVFFIENEAPIYYEIFRENQTPPPRKLKRYFIFTVLLFVLSSVPMIFTKPLRPLADLTGIHTV